MKTSILKTCNLFLIGILFLALSFTSCQKPELPTDKKEQPTTEQSVDNDDDKKEPGEEAEPKEETDPNGEAEPKEETDPNEEAEPKEETDPNGEAEPNEETDPNEEMEPNEETDPNQGTDPTTNEEEPADNTPVPADCSKTGDLGVRNPPNTPARVIANFPKYPKDSDFINAVWTVNGNVVTKGLRVRNAFLNLTEAGYPAGSGELKISFTVNSASCGTITNNLTLNL